MHRPSTSLEADREVHVTADPPADGRAAEGRGLIDHFSVELSSSRREIVAQAAGLLPASMDLYVPKLPKQVHSDGLAQIRLLHELGFKPVPHIAARSLHSGRELEDFLQTAVREAGADRVLVIGGDDATAAGPFADSAAVIASGILEASGIRHVHVAGYPDGHPHIPATVLRDDLARKAGLAQQKGLALTVVTQFSFAPDRIAGYCAELARNLPGVPVHAGIVGPTSVMRLLRFARICGVSTSLRAVDKLGLDAVKLVTQADPERQFQDLSRRKAAGAAGNLAGIHLFTFGGFVESAAWVGTHARRRAADAGAVHEV